MLIRFSFDIYALHGQLPDRSHGMVAYKSQKRPWERYSRRTTKRQRNAVHDIGTRRSYKYQEDARSEMLPIGKDAYHIRKENTKFFMDDRLLAKFEILCQCECYKQKRERQLQY